MSPKLSPATSSGWRDAVTGDTLHVPNHPLRLEPILAQPAVLAWRLTPKINQDLLAFQAYPPALDRASPRTRLRS